MNQKEFQSELLLSTWFFLYLHPDRSTGGLPTEFLTSGSSALLLFDTITCDRNALDWEKPYAKRWLSSELWGILEQEGIVQSVNMQDIAAKTILPHLHKTGIASAALDTMHSALEAIKKGKRKSNRLAIPPMIKELNKGMFAALGIEMPQALLYPGRENYFKSPRKRTPKSVEITEIASFVENQKRFIQAFKAIIPTFTLLPGIQPRSDAAAALKRNMEKEKEIVLRYAFGDPDVGHQDILDYRLGREFKADDEKIDGPRRKMAEKNLKLLLEIRKETLDVRPAVRQIFWDVMFGKRSVREVRRELREAQQILLRHLPSPQQSTFGLRLATLAILAVFFEIAVGLSQLHIHGTPSLAVSLYEYFRARSEAHHLQGLRQEYPFAFFVNEINKDRD